MSQTQQGLGSMTSFAKTLFHAVLNAGAIALGLDVAAQLRNTGSCMLVLDAGLQHATLQHLIPHARDGRRQRRLKDDDLPNIFQALAALSCPVSVGADVPLGWPVEHARFVEGWSATRGWQGAGTIPSRAHFEARLGDVVFKETFRAQRIRPLSVGADLIAQSAFVWAQRCAQLAPFISRVDVGWTPTLDPGVVLFESYPGAFVRLNYADFTDYKRHPEVRRALLQVLRRDYTLHTSPDAEAWLAWACDQKGSPDAFDSVLCALMAWDHLRWRQGTSGVQLTTPARLMGASEAAAHQAQIEREGWMLVRWSG